VSKVITTDVGRPLADIVSTVRYDDLLEDARSVLQTLVVKEREVEAVDGHWYAVRIVPYRTSKNLIDGLVLTYLDISVYKQATERMRKSQLRAEHIVDRIPAPLILLDTDLRVVTANQSFYRLFMSERSRLERHPLDRILEGRFNHPALQTALEHAFVENTGPEDMPQKFESLRIENVQWMVRFRRIDSAEDEAPLMLLALHHGTDTRHVPIEC
jgi:two-component system CheB/CheR fusion protein